MWAAAEGHADVIKTLLAAGADPNRKARVTTISERKHADHPSGGFTALMFAVRNGHSDAAKALVAGGADTAATNGDGATALILAVVNDRFDLAATLLELGAGANDGALYFAADMHDATTDMRAQGRVAAARRSPEQADRARSGEAAARAWRRSEQDRSSANCIRRRSAAMRRSTPRRSTARRSRPMWKC